MNNAKSNMNKANSKILPKRQVSGDKNLKSIINLVYLPQVNNFKNMGDKFQEETFFPTEILYTNKSQLVQLRCAVDKKILFFRIKQGSTN